MEQLVEGDLVIFTVKGKKYKYTVWKDFLREEDKGDNDKIFLDLKLDKVKFANYAYGYESRGGDWPSSRFKDFAALTRLVEALFPYCDEVTVNGKVVHFYSSSKIPINVESEYPVSFSETIPSINIDFESIVQKPKIKLNFI